MKTLIAKTLTFGVAAMLAFLLMACSDDDPHRPSINGAAGTGPTLNIVETAVDNGSFTTLVAALEAAELDDDLAGTGPFTVFAPTDAAFDLLPPGTVDTLLEPANQETLIDILTYHVIAGEVMSSDALALDGSSAEMLNGKNIRLDVVGSDLYLNLNGNREAMVAITDIECTNGVIHVIDAVLDPGDVSENIVDTAVADGNFTTLVAALQAAELDDDLAGTGPFTVFAPTDDAFDLLPAGTVTTLLDPANKAILIDILTYHVIDGDVMASDAIALDGTGAEMLNGQNVRIDVVSDEVILNLNGNREAMVIITDIECTNGVIHVIDAVLDPGDAVENIVDTAVADGNFTTLVAALQAAELDDDLAGPGPFTVFAPTDDAFDLLPAGTVTTLLDPANQATLIDILLYHVYDGSVLSPAALDLDGQSVPMLNGDTMSIDIAASELVLNLGGSRQATVTITDVLCSNGVIHVIDAVLDPGDSP
jgi:uncharacterized surface protein with fasciclin (FAS1) repeats